MKKPSYTQILSFSAFLILSILSSGITNAQNRMLKGIVKDAATQEGISYASVRIQGTPRGVLTKEDGSFSLLIDANTETLEISHTSFKKRFVEVPKPGKSHLLEILLEEREIRLDAVTIKSDGPERILEDKTLFIYDYNFDDEANLYVIIYDRKARGPKLALINEKDSIVDWENGPEGPGKLVRDCMGNVHAIGRNYACQLFVHEGEISMYVEERELFEKIVEPCIGNIGEFYYYDQHRYNGQMLDYLSVQFKEDKVDAHVFAALADQNKIHQLNDPHPDNPYNALGLSASQKEFISEADHKKLSTISAEFQFQQLAFFYPIFAPLHVLQHTIYVFDHTNGLIRTYDKEGQELNQVEFDYHKEEKGWKRSIISDKIKGDAYTVTQRNGYTTLHQIDLESGSLNGRWEIPMQHVSKIQVRDGIVYYMYKQTQYDDTKRVYRMALRGV